MDNRVIVDDPAIGDGVRLFRRIHPAHVVPDEDSGTMRVSTAAFRDLELSVDVESVMIELGLSAEWCIANRSGFRLVSLRAGGCRELRQLVCLDPVTDPGAENPAHGLVYGEKTRAVQRELRDLAIWVIPPAAPTRDFER